MCRYPPLPDTGIDRGVAGCMDEESQGRSRDDQSEHMARVAVPRGTGRGKPREWAGRQLRRFSDRVTVVERGRSFCRGLEEAKKSGETKRAGKGTARGYDTVRYEYTRALTRIKNERMDG
jgi:hypothetical protein